MKMYKRPLIKAHPVWAVLIAVIFIGGVITALELTNTTFFFHKRPQQPTAGPATKGDVNKPPRIQQNTSNSNSKDITSSDSSSTDAGIDVNAPLVDPSGIFVSNHHPNLSGKPAPNQLQSVCTTTSGAMCSISFTKDGVTKSLPSQMTDSEGSAYWTWKLQDIGLTAGSWHVEAKATLGTQTKTASDYMNLEVAE